MRIHVLSLSLLYMKISPLSSLSSYALLCFPLLNFTYQKKIGIFDLAPFCEIAGDQRWLCYVGGWQTKFQRKFKKYTFKDNYSFSFLERWCPAQIILVRHRMGCLRYFIIQYYFKFFEYDTVWVLNCAASVTTDTSIIHS